MNKKNEKENNAKKPVAGKTATGANKTVRAGKSATGANKGSGRATQPAKRTTAKPNTPKKQPARQDKSKKKNKQPKEQRILVHGVVATDETGKMVFPNKFPFWARLKIEKKRTTLVIDEVQAIDKKRKKMEEHFVHRETIHPKGDGSNVKGYEKIEPNPDPKDDNDMYLKSPTKLPKRLFKPHNRELVMPEDLRKRYEKNNHKNNE